MIFEILQIVAEDINEYLNGEGFQKPVTLENIAIVDTQNNNTGNLEDKVALTLLNLKEETTLKNFPNHKIENDKVLYKNPIVNLNVYALFSANKDSYANSLKVLSKIIAFFQGKRVFTQANTLFNRNSAELSTIKSFHFTAELYTPSFEELNFIWGTLGGRQLPSVLYKFTLIQIERDTALAGGGLITQIAGETLHIK